MRFYFLGITIALLALTASACGSKDSASSGSGRGGTPPPQVGVVEQDGMKVELINEQGKYKVHIAKSTGFADECIIPTGQLSQDITCYADVSELDAYMFGMEYNYNIPAGVCAYVARDPYYYFNEEVGYGPTNIQLTVVKDASGVVTSATCISSEEHDGTPVAGPNPINTCVANPEINWDPDDAEWECVYDRSETGGHNCCFGSYTWTTTITEGASPPETETGFSQWGGNAADCLRGPFVSSWETNSKGWPLRIIEYAKEGINKTIKVERPIDSPNNGTTLSVANNYNASLHTHDGFYVARTSTWPYAIDPVDDRNGTDLVSLGMYGNDAFRFLCLDEAYEILNRITIYTREWNTYEQFLLYLSSAGASGNQDVSGTEPCISTGIGGYCNDWADWDDLGNAFPNYPTNPATDLPDRSEYFPNRSDNN